MESAPGEGFVVYSVKRKNFNYTIIYKSEYNIGIYFLSNFALLIQRQFSNNETSLQAILF